jgi:hypothetical protein
MTRKSGFPLGCWEQKALCSGNLPNCRGTTKLQAGQHDSDWLFGESPEKAKPPHSDILHWEKY